MRRHLLTSDTAIRAIKPGDPRKRLNDGDGLHLLLFVKSGAHGWRLAYSHGGRRNVLSLGTYLATSLALARKKAAEARRQLSEGIDPSARRQAAKAVLADRRDAVKRTDAGLPALGSFEAVAREWYAKYAPKWAPSHADKILKRFERDVFPWLGDRPIGAIKPLELLSLLKRVEDRGAIETTHRVQQNCGQVFRYAVATGRAESDPTRDLRGALTPWKPEHYPTITNPREVGKLLRDIDAHTGGFVTKCALRLAPLLFVRPGELRRAEWSEFDLDAAEWRIPAGKMKSRVMHIVPLADQALAILRELHPLTKSGAWASARTASR